MSNESILNELDSLEATASLLVERCQRLRRKLRPVSTGSNQTKGGLTDEKKARLLSKRRKTQSRKKV